MKFPLNVLRGAGHDFRYRLAAGYMRSGDVVVDAASGPGYGAAFKPPGVLWIGVDVVDAEPQWHALGTWLHADLNTWKADFPFDVALSFETLEHLADPEHLVAQLVKAERVALISVPIVPTAGANPLHLCDFTLWDPPRLFAVHGWELHQFVIQPSELAGIYVFVPPS